MATLKMGHRIVVPCVMKFLKHSSGFFYYMHGSKQFSGSHGTGSTHQVEGQGAMTPRAGAPIPCTMRQHHLWWPGTPHWSPAHPTSTALYVKGLRTDEAKVNRKDGIFTKVSRGHRARLKWKRCINYAYMLPSSQCFSILEVTKSPVKMPQAPPVPAKLGDCFFILPPLQLSLVCQQLVV